MYKLIIVLWFLQLATVKICGETWGLVPTREELGEDYWRKTQPGHSRTVNQACVAEGQAAVNKFYKKKNYAKYHFIILREYLDVLYSCTFINNMPLYCLELNTRKLLLKGCPNCPTCFDNNGNQNV